VNYYGAKELAGSFRTVRANTITIAEEFPEDKYDFRATPDTRSVAEMLVHIAQGYLFQYQIHAEERRTTLDGFDFSPLVRRRAADEKIVRSKADIVALLHSTGDKFGDWLGGLTDDFLAERVSFGPGTPPASKSRFEMILGVKEHEMHHRGQLMLMERMVGVVPHLTRAMEARRAATQSAR
jgi:uncharacterized damage-inducible protein DinB